MSSDEAESDQTRETYGDYVKVVEKFSGINLNNSPIKHGDSVALK